VCVCVTCYPACIAHAPCYCHLWFVWQYHYFSYRLLNGTIYGKSLLNIKCVFIFSPQVLFEIFLILRGIQRAITINVHRYSKIVPFIVVRFNATRIFPTDFRKIFKYKISRKSVQWEPHVQTEERTGRLVKSVVSFRNFANTPENGTFYILLFYSPFHLRTASSSYLSIGDLPLSKTEKESARNRRWLNVEATFVTDLWFLQAAEMCNVCETKRIRNRVVTLLNRKNDDVDCRDCRGCCCDAERARVTALIAFNK
jgi:hypothetical protein